MGTVGKRGGAGRIHPKWPKINNKGVELQRVFYFYPGTYHHHGYEPRIQVLG